MNNTFRKNNLILSFSFHMIMSPIKVNALDTIFIKLDLNNFSRFTACTCIKIRCI